MNAKAMGQCRLPPLVAEPKNKKNVLRNDVIGHLSGLGLKWSGIDVLSAGEILVTSLTNSLWFIDGQNEVLNGRSFSIPGCFKRFSGCNRPDLSKHRKRTQENMSSFSLQTYANALFGCLHGVYWENESWSKFKPNIEKLASSMLSIWRRIANQQNVFIALSRQFVRSLNTCLLVSYHVHLLQCLACPLLNCGYRKWNLMTTSLLKISVPPSLPRSTVSFRI